MRLFTLGAVSALNSLSRHLLLTLVLAGTPFSALVEAQSTPQVQFQMGYRTTSSMLAPLLVKFHATFPPEYRVQWDFGDGQRAVGPQVDHTYYQAGTYTVQAQMLDAQGRVVSRSGGQIEVRSNGPEKTQLTILIGRGQVRLSAVDSVLYSPTTPKLLLNGREVGSAAVPLRAGQHLAAVRGTMQDGRSMEKRINFSSVALSEPSPAFESEVLRLTNRARARGWNCATLREGGPALPPLTQNSALDVAALAQSAGMALFGYFDHTSTLDGSTPSRRVQAAGMNPQVSAENIAAGQATPTEVVDAWLRSPGHCKNIMGDFSQIGISYVKRSGTTYLNYWTQVFAKP